MFIDLLKGLAPFELKQYLRERQDDACRHLSRYLDHIPDHNLFEYNEALQVGITLEYGFNLKPV